MQERLNLRLSKSRGYLISVIKLNLSRHLVHGLLCVGLLYYQTPSLAEECEGNKETIGTVTGAILGGLLGSQVGKGSGKKAATVLGAVAGGYVGNRYGESLDCEDQRYHSQTAHEALEYQPAGRPSSWNNPDSGHAGSITPIRTWQRDTGQYCRDYTQSIVIDGKVEEGRGTACREDDGTWRIVSNEPSPTYPDYSDRSDREQF